MIYPNFYWKHVLSPTFISYTKLKIKTQVFFSSTSMAPTPLWHLLQLGDFLFSPAPCTTQFNKKKDSCETHFSWASRSATTSLALDSFSLVMMVGLLFLAFLDFWPSCGPPPPPLSSSWSGAGPQPMVGIIQHSKFILAEMWKILIEVKMILHENNFTATEANSNTRSLHAEYSLHPTLLSWVLKLSCLPAWLPPAASGVPAWLGWAQKPLTDTLSRLEH